MAVDRRPAEAWCHGRASLRGADGDPPTRLHRYRAVRREGPDDGRADLGERRWRRGAGSHGRPLAVGRRADRPAHRLRQRREPAPRARIAPIAGGRAACGARRRTIAPGAPAARRIAAARVCGRGGRAGRRVRAGRPRARGHLLVGRLDDVAGRWTRLPGVGGACRRRGPARRTAAGVARDARQPHRCAQARCARRRRRAIADAPRADDRAGGAVRRAARRRGPVRSQSLERADARARRGSGSCDRRRGQPRACRTDSRPRGARR